MADRQLVVRLRAEVAEFKRDMSGAAQVVEGSARSMQAHSDRASQAQRRQADAAGQLRVAEQRLAEVRSDSGAKASQIAAAEEAVSKARRDEEAATIDAARAVREHSEAQKAAEATTSGFAQSLRDNRQEFALIGGALTAYGAAVTGIGAAVLKTGIEYNQLRQRSTAALTAITGSTEMAADQMDRLDEFATNSPFARQVFIQAQQQLMAFGMEADRVVPTLDAIQNAVAATGGSNQDIAELARIIAQVGATGKLTATDLNQLGIRGVDAATIIGEQMGLTGAQIRESITAGTLDADEAIRALTDGMQERFGGAADGVKNTLDGAFDRVKAVFRDLSASFASGLVDPEGGGLLLDFLNGIADAGRMLERVPEPIRNTAGAIALITGPLALAAGGFLLLAPRMLDTLDAARRLGIELPGFEGKLGRVGKIAGTAAAAFAGFMILRQINTMIQDMSRVDVDVDRLADAFTGLGGAQEFAAGKTDIFRASFLWMEEGPISGAEALDRFASAAEGAFGDSNAQKLRRWHSNLGSIIGLDSQLDEFTNQTLAIDSAIAQLIESGNTERATAVFLEFWDAVADNPDITFDEILKGFPQFEAHLRQTATEMGVARNEATLYAIATGTLSDEQIAAGGVAESWTQEIMQAALAAKRAAEDTGAAADATEEFVAAMEGIGSGVFESISGGLEMVAGSVVDQLEHLEELRAAYREMRDEIAGVSGSFIDITGAMSNVQAATQEWAQGQADATETSKDSWQDFYDGVSVNITDYLAELDRMAEAQANWQENLTSLVGRVSTDTLTELARLGPEGAPLIAALSDASDKELAHFEERFGEAGVGANQSFADSLLENSTLIEAAGTRLGEITLGNLIKEIEDGEINAAEAVKKYNLESTLEILADTDPVARELLDQVREIEATEAAIQLDADTRAAIQNTDRWYRDAEDLTAVSDLDADPRDADRKLTQWARDADRTTGTVDIDADPGPAVNRRGELVRETERTTATMGIDGDAAAARRAADNAVWYIQSRRPVLTVGMNRIALAGGGPVVGAVRGPGTATSDSIPAMLSNGEWVLNAKTVQAAGGFGGVAALEKAIHAGMAPVRRFADGGPVQPRFATMPAQFAGVPAPVAAAGSSAPTQVFNVTANYPQAEPATRRAQKFGEQYMAGLY